jgi:glycosyltransferase involved in cell wall biosynthesis
VRLNIVGSDMPADIQRLKAKDVEPLGYVPDVNPLFEQARVFVAPLRHGAGMKGKVGHALSFGLPVVTTSIGAEGIGLISGETALISDDPDEFANMVARLYTDEGLWTRLSSSGRELIASRFSEGVVKEKLIALV